MNRISRENFFSRSQAPAFSRSQAPAWERTFLVPKPLLGNALAGEVPRLPVTGDGPEAGASGADAFPSRGLGTRKAGAWERGTGISAKPNQKLEHRESEKRKL